MTSVRRRLGAALLSLVGVAAMVLATPSSASAAAYDGTDPDATGCSADAITARSHYIDYDGRRFGQVQLRYSPTCKTAWARIVSMLPSGCVPSQQNCGGATIHRNSDGREYSCTTPSGATQCYTRQVNDNGVEYLPDIRMLIPMRNVLSLCNFVDEIHESFILKGVTHVEAKSPPVESAPALPAEPPT